MWLHLRDFYARHRAAGGRIPPAAADFLDELRAYVYAQLTTVPDIPAPVADIPSGCDHVSTDRVAGLLDVTDRHARRLMTGHGFRQARRGMWRAEDAAALIAARKGR
ncbi:hypothetical protein [Nonomuraea angiospora]|uniref:hypothetical protein n=1 Tax=Nonomuraea angiospora TaxID=46172 RepID=UPI0029A74814|nr:hypothetical protein [Nonomuraea angiospora]MDX3099695.1 hypothetical protein [Nonomuraea angiospora]